MFNKKTKTRARRELAYGYVVSLTGRERARAPGQVNEPGLQYELHHNPYLPNINSQK